MVFEEGEGELDGAREGVGHRGGNWKGKSGGRMGTNKENGSREGKKSNGNFQPSPELLKFKKNLMGDRRLGIYLM